jgi:hypothetical protein
MENGGHVNFCHDCMWPQLQKEHATVAMHKADYNVTNGKIFFIDKSPPRRSHSTWQVMERVYGKLETDTKLRWGNTTV